MPIDVRTSGRFLDWGLLIFLRRTPLHGASMVTFAYLLTFHSITLTLTINMQYDSIPACCTHYVKWSRYRPGVAQRVGRGIALLFHDRGTRRWWVVSNTPRPHFTPGKDPVPIVQEAGWAPGPVCKGGKSRPHRDSITDRPARSQSLYRLSYPAHTALITVIKINLLISFF